MSNTHCISDACVYPPFSHSGSWLKITDFKILKDLEVSFKISLSKVIYTNNERYKIPFTDHKFLCFNFIFTTPVSILEKVRLNLKNEVACPNKDHNIYEVTWLSLNLYLPHPRVYAFSTWGILLFILQINMCLYIFFQKCSLEDSDINKLFFLL